MYLWTCPLLQFLPFCPPSFPSILHLALLYSLFYPLPCVLTLSRTKHNISKSFSASKSCGLHCCDPFRFLSQILIDSFAVVSRRAAASWPCLWFWFSSS
ncbi:hypothetical protein HDV62DRAFT_126350 [Trichoderma sp. SZMC 28011]